MIAKLLTGVAFGASLTAAGVYLPSVIRSQLRFDDWHMLQAFLTATASSALVVTFVQSLGHVTFTPRKYSTLGWFAPFDANIVGGLLQGAGMALSGACPGTVLVQTALGFRSAYFALQGALLGGLVWAGFLRPYVKQTTGDASQTKGVTVSQILGIPHPVAVLGFEAVCAALVAGSILHFPPNPDVKISPVVGGLLVGLVQLWSALSTKNLVGVSGTYEEAGDWIMWPLRGANSKRPTSTSLQLALGVAWGGWLTARAFPSLQQGTGSEVSPTSALLGGFIMAVGARVAGGCTSGHGLSGVSLLSASSLVTIGSIFVGGGVVARFVAP